MRYDRPFLELEYDGEAYRQQGCCRYVPIVLRLCGVPKQQGVRLSVSFERVRKVSTQGEPLDDYEVHPRSVPAVRTTFPNYHEYALALRARAHHEETGTIRISMTSQAGHPISEATIVFDCGAAEPVQNVCKGFSRVRLLPSIRTPEERDALGGRPAAFVTRRDTRREAPVQPVPADRGQQAELRKESLFPQDNVS